MTKHTPGPWTTKFDGTQDGFAEYAIVSNDEYIAHLVTEANARLIAAAPDLVAALRWYADPNNTIRTDCKTGESVCANVDHCKLARAILDKIDGTD